MRNTEKASKTNHGRWEELISEIDHIVEGMDSDPENSEFLVFSDFNGPIVNADSADWEPVEGLEEAAEYLESSLDHKPLLLSGWDPRTLEKATQMYLESDFDVVGDRGTTAILDDELIDLSEEDPSVLNQFRKNVYQLVTDFDAVLHEQGNYSPVVGAVKANAVAKGIENHPIYQDSVERFEAEEFFGKLTEMASQESDFRLEDNDILVENLNQDTVGTFSKVWREEYPLIGFNIEESNGGYLFEEVSGYKSQEFSFESFSERLDQIAESFPGIGLDHHSDNTSDIYRSDVRANKTYGAEKIREMRTNGESTIIFNMGDNPVDVLDKPNSVNFVVENSEAERYSEKHDIPHISAENFVDYAFAVANYVREYE